MRKILYSIFAAVLFVGLVGCGKSEAQKAAEQAAAQRAIERHDARQKFNEAVAALSVRTRGSTYEEYRQSRLSLETIYEANKSYLTDVDLPFAYLILVTSSTEYCWNYSIQNPEIPLPLIKDKQGIIAACVLRPSITNKLDYTFDQRMNDKDFNPGNFIRLGLSKTQDQCDLIISALNKPL
jgi:hypothetical protein